MNMIEKITIAITEPASVRLSRRNRGAFFFSSIVNVFMRYRRKSLVNFRCKDTILSVKFIMFMHFFAPIYFYPFTPHNARLVPTMALFCHIRHTFVE